ncbi:hypothetical protein BH10PSE7_BH10PSE7_12360 [soil metagenome]
MPKIDALYEVAQDAQEHLHSRSPAPVLDRLAWPLLGLAGSMILMTAEMAAEQVIADHYHTLLLTQIDVMSRKAARTSRFATAFSKRNSRGTGNDDASARAWREALFPPSRRSPPPSMRSLPSPPSMLSLPFRLRDGLQKCRRQSNRCRTILRPKFFIGIARRPGTAVPPKTGIPRQPHF